MEPGRERFHELFPFFWRAAHANNPTAQGGWIQNLMNRRVPKPEERNAETLDVLEAAVAAKCSRPGFIRPRSLGGSNKSKATAARLGSPKSEVRHSALRLDSTVFDREAQTRREAHRSQARREDAEADAEKCGESGQIIGKRGRGKERRHDDVDK